MFGQSFWQLERGVIGRFTAGRGDDEKLGDLGDSLTT